MSTIIGAKPSTERAKLLLSRGFSPLRLGGSLAVPVLRPYVATLLVAVVAITVHAWPGAVGLLQYDRTMLAAGQGWRFFTAHFTHWNADHLFWDLVMFVVLGILIEAQSRRCLLGLIVASALAISGIIWFSFPELSTYRGLSGIDTTLFVYLACSFLIDAIKQKRWSRCLVPGLLLASATAKFSYEAVTGSTLFVHSEAAGFTVFIEAHLIGVLVGAVAAALCRPTHRMDRATAC